MGPHTGHDARCAADPPLEPAAGGGGVVTIERIGESATVHVSLRAGPHSRRRMERVGCGMTCGAVVVVGVIAGLAISGAVPRDSPYHYAVMFASALPILLYFGGQLVFALGSMSVGSVRYRLRGKHVELDEPGRGLAVPLRDIMAVAAQPWGSRTLYDPTLPPPDELRQRRFDLVVRLRAGWLRVLGGIPAAAVARASEPLLERMPNRARHEPTVSRVASPGTTTLPRWLWGFLFPALLVGAAWLLWSFQVGRGRATYAWPSAPGTIEHARWERDEGKCVAEVRYHYVVGGTTYAGARLGFGWPNDDPVIERFLRDHPAGSPVQVFYDPRDPGRAVVVRGASPFWPPVVWAMGLIVLVFVALQIRSYPRAAERRVIDPYR